MEEINNNSILNFCQYYHEKESQSYIVQCMVTNDKKKKQLKKITEKIRATKSYKRDENNKKEVINSTMTNIGIFLKCKQDFVINQSVLGIKKLFQEFTVKIQVGNE